MTTKLSDDLRQAIEKGGGSPVHWSTRPERALRLMRAEQYDKARAVFEHDDRDFDPRESYPFVDEVMRRICRRSEALKATSPSPSESHDPERRYRVVAFPYATGGGGKNRPGSSSSVTVTISGSQIRSSR